MGGGWLRWAGLTRLEIAMCALIGMILGITGVIALLAPLLLYDRLQRRQLEAAR